jgi:hypothetical protein
MAIHTENGHETLVLLCDASDGDYLQVEFDLEDSEWRYLEVTDLYRPRAWRDRAKMAWKALRGQEFYGGSVILNEQSIIELVEYLKDKSQ